MNVQKQNPADTDYPSLAYICFAVLNYNPSLVIITAKFLLKSNNISFTLEDSWKLFRFIFS